jgi:putative (di)nucleoside polyphosphate hydrolase
MLINAAGLVWIGRRLPKWRDDSSAFVWQMPQGGIDDGEAADAAAYRELREETGIHSAEIIAEASEWLSYDLPPELVGVALKGKYRGQTQKWFAMRFTGHETEIDISAKHGHEAEFDAWRWAAVDELPQLIVPFKRDTYQRVIAEFADLTRKMG